MNSKPVLKEGDRGAAVEFVQRGVGALPIDGSYVPITKKCVMEFQRSKGIR